MQRRDATLGGSPGRTGKVFIALRLREVGGVPRSLRVGWRRQPMVVGKLRARPAARLFNRDSTRY